jgi:hypothetical protein
MDNNSLWPYKDVCRTLKFGVVGIVFDTLEPIVN